MILYLVAKGGMPAPRWRWRRVRVPGLEKLARLSRRCKRTV